MVSQSCYRGTSKRYDDKDWLFGQAIVPHKGPNPVKVSRGSRTEQGFSKTLEAQKKSECGTEMSKSPALGLEEKSNQKSAKAVE